MGISDAKIIAQQRNRERAYVEAEYFLKTLAPAKRPKGQFAMRHFPPRSGILDVSQKTHQDNCIEIKKLIDNLSQA